MRQFQIFYLKKLVTIKDSEHCFLDLVRSHFVKWCKGADDLVCSQNDKKCGEKGRIFFLHMFLADVSSSEAVTHFRQTIFIVLIRLM